MLNTDNCGFDLLFPTHPNIFSNALNKDWRNDDKTWQNCSWPKWSPQWPQVTEPFSYYILGTFPAEVWFQLGKLPNLGEPEVLGNTRGIERHRGIFQGLVALGSIIPRITDQTTMAYLWWLNWKQVQCPNADMLLPGSTLAHKPLSCSSSSPKTAIAAICSSSTHLCMASARAWQTMKHGNLSHFAMNSFVVAGAFPWFSFLKHLIVYLLTGFISGL